MRRLSTQVIFPDLHECLKNPNISSQPRVFVANCSDEFMTKKTHKLIGYLFFLIEKVQPSSIMTPWILALFYSIAVYM